MRDNNVRRGSFEYYIHQNMVAVAVDLGFGVIAQLVVKLRGVFVEDSEALSAYFADLVDADILVRHYDKPAQQAFYLVELFVEREGEETLLSVNHDLIEKGIVKKWSGSKDANN